jgi:hypothetical protein
LDRSVKANAGIASLLAAATASPMRTMPSAMEYSLCRRRWINEGDDILIRVADCLQFYHRGTDRKTILSEKKAEKITG